MYLELSPRCKLLSHIAAFGEADGIGQVKIAL